MRCVAGLPTTGDVGGDEWIIASYGHRDSELRMAGHQGALRSDTRMREALFVEHYFANGMNATHAAISAGYSAATAGVTGSQILVRPRVAAAIAKRRAELLSTAALTAEEVIKSLARAVRFDPGKLYYPVGHPKAGELKPIYELDDDTRLELEGFDVDSIVKFVKKIKEDKTTGKKRTEIEPVIIPRIKYDLPKKSTARDQAMKHFGLYAKDKQGARPEDDVAPPAGHITIEYKDARRKPDEPKGS